VSLKNPQWLTKTPDKHRTHQLKLTGLAVCVRINTQVSPSARTQAHTLVINETGGRAMEGTA